MPTKYIPIVSASTALGLMIWQSYIMLVTGLNPFSLFTVAFILIALILLDVVFIWKAPSRFKASLLFVLLAIILPSVLIAIEVTRFANWNL